MIRQTCDVDLARQGNVGLADGAEQSAVVDQPCDAIVDDEFSEKFVVQHVGVHKWAWRKKNTSLVAFKSVKNDSAVRLSKFTFAYRWCKYAAGVS